MRRLFAITAALVAAIALTSCAGDSGADAHNDVDVTFAQQMIPHHRQAVQMAALAAGRAEDPRIIALAAQIADAQDPEIKTMSGWLKNWGEKVPADSGMADMSSMPGMMTEQQMSDLTAATGQAFDAMFVQMMTAHHSGAVAMAEQQIKNGKNQAAKDLAANIVKTQTAEIKEMQNLQQHG